MSRLPLAFERKLHRIALERSKALEFDTTSVVDPDPHRSEFILFGWIRIEVGKKDPEKK